VEELDMCYSGVIGDAYNSEQHPQYVITHGGFDVCRISHAGASQRPSRPPSSLCNPQHMQRMCWSIWMIS